MTTKCIFCEWENATKEERDSCKWEPCEDCKVKCGLTKNVNDLKSKGFYALIMQYPYPGIPRSEKHALCEWLMKQNGDIQ